MIGHPQGLRFEFALDPNDTRGLAWGEGRLLLAGEPIWFGEGSAGNKTSLQWTWVDLLEFLGRAWPWLIAEEGYPLPVQPLYPAFFLPEAERRWAELPDTQIDDEEALAHRFLARHDLAAALKGMFLPAVIVLRQGNTGHISAATLCKTLIRPWREIEDTLEKAGNYLAAACEESTQSRAQQACAIWHQREERRAQLELDLTTGHTPEERSHLETLGVTRENWQIPEIRAAARMTRGVVTPEHQAILLAEVARTPRCVTPKLDALSASCLEKLRERDKPHEQGYWLASWLRGKLGIDAFSTVEPRDFLSDWAVQVQEIELEKCPIEAITAWGDQHGPAILINRAVGCRSAHEYGARATLAHEMAHLLLDRDAAFPAGEVLGGRTPEYPEKRARAFAAEFLVPRCLVEKIIRESHSLEEAVQVLQHENRVSKELLAWQIHNSSAYDSLMESEKIILEQWKMSAQFI